MSEQIPLSESAIDSVPNRPGVFLLRMKDPEQQPYLSRTRVLKRRLLRLARMPKLLDGAASIEFWLTGSTLAGQILFYELARTYFPDRYLKLLNLRMPHYLRLSLGTAFPRSQIVSQLSPRGLSVGPFRSRLNAERFEAQFLDLFRIRRCPDELRPSPSHPGCAYGEMGMCLRPCQEMVTVDEYGQEADRAAEFLATAGATALQDALAVRDGLSETLDFEEAARQHKLVARILELHKLQDEFALPVDQLQALTITPSLQPESVELSLFRGGHWQGTQCLAFPLVDGRPVSLDRTARTVYSKFPAVEQPPRERQEYLAIAARWFYSSWRDGELLVFKHPGEPPYRKLVQAISRVYRGAIGATVTPDRVPL